MKPIIGILPLFDEKKESYWMLPGYMKGIANAGGIPVMLPFIENIEDIKQLSENFDGFLFTGGPDIDPAYYHEEKKENCGDLTPYRDTLESQLFKEVYALNKPILGICRGHQLLNVLCGGTLYDNKQHTVTLVEDTPLKSLFNKTILPVNSCHHQAIKELGNDLQPMAISEDGLVESCYVPNKKFVWGVQWHPEFMYTEKESQKIFEEFIRKCKK